MTLAKHLAQDGRQDGAAGQFGRVGASEPDGAYLTTGEAAKRLNLTPRRIRYKIRDGLLNGSMHGRDYLISSGDVQILIVDREEKKRPA